MIFQSTDGVRIHTKSYMIANALADILVVHGMGEHSGRYQEFAERLNRARFNVHTCDLRGHGCSEGRAGHVAEFAQFHKDTEAWANFLKEQQLLSASRPIFLFGHSLGGLILLDFLLHHRSAFGNSVAGLALSAPALGILSPMAFLKPILDAKILQLIDDLHFPNGIKAEHLSHDAKVVADFKEDPLVHSKITLALFRGMLDAIEAAIHTKASLPCPVVFFVPEEDKLVDPDATLKFSKKVSAPQIEVHSLRGFYHEVFNEKKREAVYATLIEWLRNCLHPENPKPSAQRSSKSSGRKATAKVISRSPRERKANSIST